MAKKNTKIIVDETPGNEDKKATIEIEAKDDDARRKKPGSKGSAVADKATEKPADEPEAGKKTEYEELAAEKDRYLRLAAEYDNFRKRTAKERDSIYGNAQADTINRLLPVYDSLERALKQKCTDEAYFKGIELTMQQLIEILKDIGVVPIPALGEAFDPNVHNAVLRIEDSNFGEGIVAEETRKGFMLGERVIRFSEVVVAN